MTKKLTQKDAYRLFHEGALALADVEANGFRIDVSRLDKTIERITKKIDRLTEKLKQDEVWEIWKEIYPNKPNMGSRAQLGRVLFEEMKYKSAGMTAKGGRHKTDEASLEMLDILFVKKYLTVEKLKKLRSTYLRGIRTEVVGEFVHANYNLNLVISFRSSCDSPNIQNQPAREERIAELIRSCFISRENHQILEVDYSAVEFRICAAFWRDKNLIAYASDPEKDVHRDMAMEAYILTKDQVTKQARFYTKNQFVFPQLYGSFYVPCARNLWFAIENAKLKTADDGCGLKKHMKRLAGIDRLGKCNSKLSPEYDTFELHIKDVEERFLGQFPQFAKRKEQWWNQYQKTGKFSLLTGFQVQGVYTKNQLLNIPIQGPAFHCLLWSLTRLNTWLRKKKMRSLIVGTIHDSIIFDAHKDELEEVIRKAQQVMTQDIRKAWDWIIVPLEVDFEVSPVGGSWLDKKEIKI